MNEAQDYINKAANLYFNSDAARVAHDALLEIWDDLSPRLSPTEKEQMAANILLVAHNMRQMDDELDLLHRFHVEVNNASDRLNYSLTPLTNKEQK